MSSDSSASSLAGRIVRRFRSEFADDGAPPPPLPEMTEEDEEQLFLLKQQTALQKINEFLDKIGLLENLKEQTGVPKIYLAVGVLILLSVVTIRWAGFPAFCNFVGLVYPAYMSFKTIEREADELSEEDDHIHWLMYWAVFGTFHVLETLFTPLFIRLRYFYHFKFFLLCWCFLPQTRGATHVYNICIRPFLEKHGDRLDDHINEVQRVGLQATGEISRLGTQLFGNAAQSVTKQLIQSIAEASSRPASTDQL